MLDVERPEMVNVLSTVMLETRMPSCAKEGGRMEKSRVMTVGAVGPIKVAWA